MHVSKGYPDPTSTFYISSLLRGIRRELSKPPAQKAPITPAILLQIHNILDLSQPMAITFWATSLLAFYSFLRKASLIPKSQTHSCIHESCIRDLIVSDSGYLLKIKHTKTLQYRDRILSIPFSKIHNSSLCPVRAISKLLSQNSQIPPSAPLVSYPISGGSYRFFTHSTFENYLNKALALAGQSPSSFSGHSFRRGGASFAFSCGVPADLIKIQGDWSSDAYLRYLSSPLSHRQQVFHSISHHISKLS